MSAAVEGTGKETFYTSHGVRLGKIVAFNPPGSKWYIRAMKYNPSGGGYWAKKGDRIVSSKKGLWWGSKEEAMQLSSIEKWLQALQPATRGGTRGRSRRKQAAPTKKAAAQVQEKFPAEQVPRTSSKGVNILDLLAQIKANELTGGDTELVYSGALLQAMQVGTRKRRKQVGRFGTRRKERQTNEGKPELQADRLEWRKIQIELFQAFMRRGDMECIVDKYGAPCRFQDLSPAGSKELTRRVGSVCEYLQLVNESSDKVSNIDTLALKAGRPFGLAGSTVQGYLTAYIKHGVKFVTSQRGSWARIFALADEDIKARCYVWLKSRKMITAKEFMIFLNKEVMCEEAVVKIMGEGKQICEDTARLWLHKLNCKYVAKQKSYYTDTHEKYIEYRAHFLQRCSKCSKKTQAQPAPNKKKPDS